MRRFPTECGAFHKTLRLCRWRSVDILEELHLARTFGESQVAIESGLCYSYKVGNEQWSFLVARSVT